MEKNSLSCDLFRMKMADPDITTRVVAQKLCNSTPLEDYGYSHINAEHGLVCLEHENGDISLSCVTVAARTPNVLKGITSFIWEISTKPSFAVVTKDVSLAQYEVAYQVLSPSKHRTATQMQHVPQCVSQCHFQTLKSICEDAGQELTQQSVIQLLSFQDGVLVLLVNRNTLMVLNMYKDKPPDLIEIKPLKDTMVEIEKDEHLSAKLYGNLVMVQHNEGVLALYSVLSGHQVAVVEYVSYLSQHGFSCGDSHQAKITQDFMSLVITDSNKNLFKIDLNSYFQDNPQYLHNDGIFIPPITAVPSVVDEDIFEQTPNPSKMVTSAYGDKIWKQQLCKLYTDMTGDGSHFSGADSEIKRNWFECLGFSVFVPSEVQQRSVSESQIAAMPMSGLQPRDLPTDQGMGVPDVACNQGSATDGIVSIALPDDYQGWEICAMATSFSSVSLWIKAANLSAILIYDLQTGKVVQESLPSNSLVVLSEALTMPHLVLTKDTIELVAFHVEQEEFVNKVMMYANATVADSLCRINSWDRCAIPLHALEVGLKHRQLDTVAFFLKSRENIFTLPQGSGFILGTSVPVSPAPGSMMAPVFSYYAEMDLVQVESAVRLLINTIKDNIHDHQSKQFAEQLLHITLDYLHKLTRNAVTALNELMLEQVEGEDISKHKDEIESSLERLTDFIMELRQCLKDIPKYPAHHHHAADNQGKADDTDGVADDTYQCTEYEEGFVLRWKHMAIKEVILDSICQNCIPLAQSYLKQRKQTSSMERIISVGLEQALDYVVQHQLAAACELLENMGFDVNSKLRQVCFYTPHKDVREFLLAELQLRGQLTDEERRMINFVHQVESLYHCQSFERARLLRVDAGQSCMKDDLDLQPKCKKTGAEVLQNCGDLVPLEEQNYETAHYIHVLLEWIRTWDTTTRERTLLDLLMFSKDSVHIDIKPQTIWEYLTNHNDYERLYQWIKISFPVDADVETSPASHLFKNSITVEMTENLVLCLPYMKEKILDELARRGVFTSTEIENFHLLLCRLSRTHQTISTHHPLELRYTTHQLDIVDFHKKMVHLLIQKNMAQILYFYLDYFGLALADSSLQDLGLTDSVPNWVKMMIQFRLLGHNVTDPKLVFQASLASSDVAYKLNNSTIADMLEHGHVITAVASLLYAECPLSQIVSGAPSNDPAIGHIKPEILEQALTEYPKLQGALFSNNSDDGVSEQDITVYQLLQGNAGFDIARLFGWQSTNTLAQDVALKEMPHFSNPALMAKYIRHNHLSFTYYLKHGRPTFAFTAFIGDEIRAGATAVSVKRQLLVCQKAHLLAIKSFSLPTIAAACVAFIELMGRDSTTVRLHVQVAQVILNYRNSVLTGTLEQRRDVERQHETETAQLLLSCARRRKGAAQEVLPLLEAALTWKIDKSRWKRTSPESGKTWLLAVLFAEVHGLPLPTVYLRDCLQADDWLKFLSYAQAYQYPKEKLLEVLPSCQARHLREHLQYVVENVQYTPISDETETQTEKKSRQSMGTMERNVRASLYARMGIGAKGGQDRDRPSGESSSCSEDETAGMGDKPVLEGSPLVTAAAPSADFTVNPDLVADDVFGVLFACQTHPTPWKALLAHSVALRNPILAVLGACFQNTHLLSCLCSWLISSLDEGTCSSVLQSIGYQSGQEWTLDQLKVLLDCYMDKQWVSTVVMGFRVFMNTSPLVPFLEFYSTFTDQHNFEQCQQKLEEFKDVMYKYRKQAKDESPGTQILMDVQWIEQTTTHMLKSLLLQLSSAYDVLHLLKLVDHSNVTRMFDCQVPDFNQLCRLAYITYTSQVPLECSKLLDTSDKAYKDYCSEVVCMLQDRELFNEARVFAEISGVAKDSITIKQLTTELQRLEQSYVWSSVHGRMLYWAKCCDMISKHQVAPEIAGEFFKMSSAKAGKHKERAYLLELSINWYNQDDDGASHTDVVEEMQLEVWKCHIQAEMEAMEGGLTDDVPHFDIFGIEDPYKSIAAKPSKDELLHYGKMPRAVSGKGDHGLSEKEILALESLVGKLLDHGRIKDACKLAAQFDHYSQDLAIVVTCMRLSQAAITVDEVDSRMKMLLTQAVQKRKRTLSITLQELPRTMSTTSLASVASVVECTPEDDVVVAMEKLQHHCRQGQQCCERIITAYKIAQILPDYSYEDVICESEFTMLSAVLHSHAASRFSLAKSYISTVGLSDLEVCGFLADAIVKSLKIIVNIRADVEPSPSTGHELLFNPSRGSEAFTQLIKLCRDPSLLGNRLLEVAKSSLASPTIEMDSRVSLDVELIIRAHDCYTVACNMEGIANVLRTARKCTERLAEAREFQLMISLLTGVGRFSEMIYIFDTLKQYHQFEQLFRKGIEKEDKLRLALLDYLRRYHPTDREAYTMVSLHFTMYREIAHMLEETARKQLSAFKSKTLDSSSDTSNKLQHIVQVFSDAAESFIKDDCLRHAQTCVKQARLVALQVHMLGAGQRVINLATEGVTKFIVSHPKFYEAFIVSEAYNDKNDWATALYNHVILNGDIKYLQDFQAHVGLTPSVVNEVADRFKRELPKGSHPTANMKRLLSHCKDILAMYKLARDLAFHDMADGMLKGEAGAYLRDITQVY